MNPSEWVAEKNREIDALKDEIARNEAEIFILKNEIKAIRVQVRDTLTAMHDAITKRRGPRKPKTEGAQDGAEG